jgi:hypothetical protein
MGLLYLLLKYAAMRKEYGEKIGKDVRIVSLTLSLLILHICGVSKTFGEWYQKTNITEDTNKLTLLASK